MVSTRRFLKTLEIEPKRTVAHFPIVLDIVFLLAKPAGVSPTMAIAVTAVVVVVIVFIISRHGIDGRQKSWLRARHKQTSRHTAGESPCKHGTLARRSVKLCVALHVFAKAGGQNGSGVASYGRGHRVERGCPGCGCF